MVKKSDIIFLFIAIGFIIWQHFYYFTELYYDRDLCGYVYNTLDILRGRGWYYSTWHIKPPGIDLILLAAFKLFGQSFKSIYLVALCFNLVSVFLVYYLSKRLLSKETKFYFLLPVFFTLFFTASPFHTYADNTEVFLLPFEIAGILFLGLNRYSISGLLLGIGFMVRQTVFLTFISGLLFIIMISLSDKQSFKKTAKSLLRLSLAFLFPCILAACYFLYKGVFDKFFNYAFAYNFGAFDEYLSFIRKQNLPTTIKIFWSNLDFEIIFFGMLSLCALSYTAIRRTRLRLLCSFWFLIICLWLLKAGVYPHHFIQLIVPLSCISLLGFSDIFEGIKKLPVKSYLKKIITGMLILLLLIPYLRLIIPIVSKSRLINYDYMAEERFSVAQYIRKHTSPDDKVFIWDNHSLGAILLWAGRNNVSVFHEKYAFLPTELREYWVPYVEDYRLNQKQLLLDLERSRPKYIILVNSYQKLMRCRSLFIRQIASQKDCNAILREKIESEKKAFPGFFALVEGDYHLEGKFGMCWIYRITQ